MSAGACERVSFVGGDPTRLHGNLATDAAAPNRPEHLPVMLAEVVALTDELPSGYVIDATVGDGGHSAAILSSNPEIHIIGIDRDPKALETARRRLAPWSERVQLIHDDFRRLPQLANTHGWKPLSGVLLDLGVSTAQLQTPERGFSFRLDGPLDMRMNPAQFSNAAEIVNLLPEKDLGRLISKLGEERYARRIARAIVRARGATRLQTTTELAAVIKRAVPSNYGPISPSTRTFQALRIAVNDELTGLQRLVIEASRLLQPAGRLLALAFHSLEDRPVKRALKHLASDCVCPPELPRCSCAKQSEIKILTSRPLRPDENELRTNPRARSARLRAAQRR